MKNLFIPLAALLFFGTAAHATTAGTPGSDPFMVRAGETQVSTTCLTDHPGARDWNVGAAPFASSEAEANAKLHDWLQVVVKQNLLTADDASRIEAWVKDHPQGDATTAIKGAHADFMASSEVGKPVVQSLCYDPDYQFMTKDGYGKSFRALTALSWTIPNLSKGTLLFSRFFWCYNWAGEWILLAPPTGQPAQTPVAQHGPCAHAYFSIPPNGTWHQIVLGRRSMVHDGCPRTLVFLKGGHGKIRHCSGCTMESSIQDLKNKDYITEALKGTGLEVSCLSPDGCVLDEQLDSSFTERTPDYILLNCFSMPSGNRSLVKDVHWRAFQPNPADNGQMEAYVVFDRVQVPPAWLNDPNPVQHVPDIWAPAPGWVDGADDAQASDAPADSTPDNGDPSQQ